MPEPAPAIEDGPIEGEPGSNMPPPPDEGAIGPEPGGGGASQPSVQTQEEEPPPASAETMENLQQQLEEDQRQEEFEEDVARPTEDRLRFEEWAENNKPDSPSANESYSSFTKYSIKMLDRIKDDPEKLNTILSNFEERKASKIEDGKPHHFEDYNIAYINILLNR